jgi:hypothetical protein
MADRTGLEPATSGVTGRHSNQLNYRSALKTQSKLWWVLQGSNLRPTACKAVALPTELNTLKKRTRIVTIGECESRTLPIKVVINTVILKHFSDTPEF